VNGIPPPKTNKLPNSKNQFPSLPRSPSILPSNPRGELALIFREKQYWEDPKKHDKIFPTTSELYQNKIQLITFCNALHVIRVGKKPGFFKNRPTRGFLGC
jgi:hypothetical protein